MHSPRVRFPRLARLAPLAVIPSLAVVTLSGPALARRPAAETIVVGPADALGLEAIVNGGDPSVPRVVVCKPGDYDLSAGLLITRPDVSIVGQKSGQKRPHFIGSEAGLFDTGVIIGLAPGADRVTLRDLRLDGAPTAIQASGAADLTVASAVVDVAIRALQVEFAHGVSVRDNDFTVSDSFEVADAAAAIVVTDAALGDPEAAHGTVPPPGPWPSIEVRDNRLAGAVGVVVLPSTSTCDVVDNAIEAAGTGVIAISSGPATLVAGNRVHAAGVGILAPTYADTTSVLCNDVTISPRVELGAQGIGILAPVQGGSPEISGNDVSFDALVGPSGSSGSSFGILVPGLDVWGDHPLTVDDNRVHGEVGIGVAVFAIGPSLHVRRNDVRLGSPLMGDVGYYGVSVVGGRYPDFEAGWEGADAPTPSLDVVANQVRANDVGDSDRRPVGIATFFDVQPSTPGASRVVDNDLHGTFSVAIASKGSDANVKRNTVKGRFDAGIDTTQVLVPDGVGAPVDYFASLPAEAFHSQVVDNDLTLQGNGSGVAIVTEPGAVVRGNHLAGF